MIQNLYKKNIMKIRKIAYNTIIVVFIWVAISCMIQRLKCPKMTETEILMNLPNSFIGDWKGCK